MSSLKLSDSIGYGWPLHPQHVGQQRLSDVQGLAVIAVKHHEQPAGEPLLEAMRSIAETRTCSRKACNMGSIEQLLADNKLHEQKLDEINRRFAPQAPPKPAEKVKTS